MPDAYIIDAYNVIRLLLSPAEAGRGSEASRGALEARIRTFRNACGPGTRIYLVYDGDLGMPAPPRTEKGFEVYFSRPPRQADDVVLDLARKHEGEPGIHIVTSDFTDIGHRLHGLRVKHLTSREFADLVNRRVGRPGKGKRPERGEDADGDAGKPKNLSRDEVDAWTREFGFGEEPGKGSP